MAKGREKSDDHIVPEGRRKAVPTECRVGTRGGKGVTASKQACQLELNFEPADSPRGADGGADTGQPVPATRAVPMSESTERKGMPAMVMEEVARYENLMGAFKQVAANRGAPGPDRRSIEWVRKHLSKLLPHLRRELLNGSFRPGMIRRVWILKPGGGNRGLGIPDVVDRMVQQAVARVLTPHYDPHFHKSSHGFREGRGCHTAIAEAVGYLEEGYEWLVDIDLERFFDRIHHDRLLSKLGQKVEDRRLLELIRRMLKAKVVMPDGVVVSTEEGAPQGGPLSPLLSNIVLDELDWELSRRGHRFVRYADDCNIYVRSERAGRRVMASISRFVERRLRLKVNESKSTVAKPEERHFLGFRLWRDPEDGSVEVLLSGRSVQRIYEKIKLLTPRTWGQSVRECIREINTYLTGWIGFFRIVTEAEERRLGAIDAHIRRRLRAIVLRHWKCKRTIIKRLTALGAGSVTTGKWVYGAKRSCWPLSHCPPVDRALRNNYFADLGLDSVVNMWRYFQLRAAVDPKQLRLPLG